MLSVTADSVPVEVPPDRVNTTVAPPKLTLVPPESFPVRVIVTGEPEETVPLETETTAVEFEGGPGVTVIWGSVVVMFEPFKVAVREIVVPGVPPVNVAE